MVYVDDVFISCRDEWEHKRNLEVVMNILLNAGKHVNINKIKCAQMKVSFLGFDVFG